jgi:hypothetical protein
MTGFESAGFDQFAISLFASRPGRKTLLIISRRWFAIVEIAKSDFQAWLLPGVNCRPVPWSQSPKAVADKLRF